MTKKKKKGIEIKGIILFISVPRVRDSHFHGFLWAADSNLNLNLCKHLFNAYFNKKPIFL